MLCQQVTGGSVQIAAKHGKFPVTSFIIQAPAKMYADNSVSTNT